MKILTLSKSHTYTFFLNHPYHHKAGPMTQTAAAAL